MADILYSQVEIGLRHQSRQYLDCVIPYRNVNTKNNRFWQLSINKRFREFLAGNSTFLCKFHLEGCGKLSKCDYAIETKHIISEWITAYPGSHVFKWNEESGLFSPLELTGDQSSVIVVCQFFKEESRRMNTKEKQSVSFFQIGDGIITLKESFSPNQLNQRQLDEIKATITKHQGIHGAWSTWKLIQREMKFGAKCHKMSLAEAEMFLTKKETSPKVLSWKKRLTPERKRQILKQLQVLEEIEVRLNRCGIFSTRSRWTQVFPSVCLHPVGNRFCGNCRICKQKFVQALLVLVAAQGVADVRCLGRWAAIFRHQRYR